MIIIILLLVILLSLLIIFLFQYELLYWHKNKYLQVGKEGGVYLVDFSCYKPPCFYRVPLASFLEHAFLYGKFDKSSIDLMEKVLESSGQGQETHLPPSLQYIPPTPNHEDSIEEAHTVLLPVMENLLERTGVSADEIDIVIVNCSGLCPSPSLSSIVVNRFKMRDDVKSFNLSGMGCSASILAVDMASNLLKVHKNSYAVILSTEILSTGWYPGNDKSKLVLNCLFRMGSAAILLTNVLKAQQDHNNNNNVIIINKPKYKLVHTLRSQRAFDDKAYLSAIREEDDEGLTGVTLTRDLLQVAGELLKTSIIEIGMSILPLSEKINTIIAWMINNIKQNIVNNYCYGYGDGRSSSTTTTVKDHNYYYYVPNFKSIIDHFCLPTSGWPVIREIKRALRLDDVDVEPAIATLQRFGNQSSSSLWYQLAYIEAKQKMKIGDKVWQLGMGSGPKITSVVWECVRSINKEDGPWTDCLHNYPIQMKQ